MIISTPTELAPVEQIEIRYDIETSEEEGWWLFSMLCLWVHVMFICLVADLSLVLLLRFIVRVREVRIEYLIDFNVVFLL